MIAHLYDTLPVAPRPETTDAADRERLRALAGEIGRWADGDWHRTHFTSELVRCCEIAAEHPDIIAEGALKLLEASFARTKKVLARHGH